MKFAMWMGFLLCILLIIVGILVWFTDNSFVSKLIASLMCIFSGSGMLSVGLALYKEEF